MPSVPPSPPLITSALGLGVEAFVTVRAAMQAGIADVRAAFELTLGPPPADWGFLVLAGLEPLIDALERLRPRVEELEWLESIGAIDARARRKLTESRFACDVDAVPEGTVVFPGEAVLMVEGPFWQAQLVGGLIRGALGDASLVATRFARMQLASGSADVIEHGAGTAHRLGGMPTLARAAYVGGARATTSALAGRRYQIPIFAMPPPWIEAAIGDEQRALRAWLGSCEADCVLRIHPARAKAVLSQLASLVRERSGIGERRVAVELPAGDRAGLAAEVVRAFAEAGLAPPLVIVSGNVDERLALDLRHADIPAVAFAVSAEAGPRVADFARYELASIEDKGSWSPRLRMGHDAESSSDPGRKLLVRYRAADGRPVADVSHAMNERMLRADGGRYVDRATGFETKLTAVSGTPLRTAFMRSGKRASTCEALDVVQERVVRGLAAIDAGYRRIASPARYPVGVTPSLAARTAALLGRSRASATGE